MNKFKGIVLVLIIGLYSPVFGDTFSDSLNAIILKAVDDSNKVSNILTLAKHYLSTDPIVTIRLAGQARDLALQLGYQKGAALSYKLIGNARFGQAKYLDALQNWQQALTVFQKIGDQVGISNMYSNIGAIYQVNGDDAKALESHLKSLKVAEAINDSTRIMTSYINIGAVYYNKPQTYEKAKENYEKALPIGIALDDKDAIGTITVNIGEIYFKRGDDTTALKYFQQSYEAYGEESESAPYSLNDIGMVYCKRGDFNTAIKYHTMAYEKAKKLDSKLDMVFSFKLLGQTYQKKRDPKKSIEVYMKAHDLAIEVKANNELKEIYEGMVSSYEQLHDYSNAFRYQALLLGIKDTLYNAAIADKLKDLMAGFEIEKKQGQIALLNKDAKIKEQEIRRQKLVRNGFIGGFAVVLLFAGIVFRQRNRISKEKKRSDELLLNILPEETAEELKATGAAKAKSFDSVSILFTDFKNFTLASEILSAEELVQEINLCYSEFDRIVTKYGIEKIKTIGDAYMCAGGLPTTNNTHPVDVIKAGLEMQAFIERNKEERIKINQPYFELRLGIHTGPVVAGVVGIKKFAYDIWGDTVNTASRMESSGEIGRVNISGTTYELVKDHFNCTHRGKVKAKNKGEIDMYFVEGVK